MSLINDALKRAQESQRQNSPGALAPLRPVERPVKPQRQSWGWMVSVAVICLIAAAFLFMGLALARHTAKPMAALPETPDSTVAGTSATAPPRPAATVATAKAASAATAPETAAPPADSLPVIGPAAIASGNTSSEPAKPPLVIQGIVNDPVHPWAIISGRTLYVGDSIRGLRVTAISRNSVTLVGDGQTNRLVVGQAQ